MADNLTTQSATPATVPASSVIATDDVAGVHFQKIKIDVGGDGASAALGTANPLPVSDAGGSLTVDGTVTANLAAGTNNIGDVDILSIAAGDNNIGNVDVVSSALPSGAATSAKQDTEITALQAIQVAVEALDNAVAGSELQVDIVGSLPAGTNAIGKLAANSGVDIGDVDVTSMPGTVVEDAPSVGGETLVLIGAVRNDSAIVQPTSANGDYGTVVVDNFGRLGVTSLGGALTIQDGGSSITVDVIPGTGATNLGKAEDAVHVLQAELPQTAQAERQHRQSVHIVVSDQRHGALRVLRKPGMQWRLRAEAQR